MKKEQGIRLDTLFLFLVREAGLEPARGYPQQILSLHRLPFRHAGLPSQRYLF